MHQPRANLGKTRRQRDKSDFKVARQRLRSPEIDTEPSNSPLEAMVRGLVSIGDRVFKGRQPMLRVP